MTGHDSAYTALGLRPGAKRAEVDEAYRRLIKQHHPDHAGGDGGRAAEINSAYSLLRKRDREWRPQPRAVAVPPHAPPRRRRSGRFGTALVGAAAIAAVVLVIRDEVPIREAAWAQPIEAASVAPEADAAPDPRIVEANQMDEPLSASLINKAVTDAVQLYQLEDVKFLDEYSRACTSWMRERPSVGAFDSCTAFDEAVAILQSADPSYDSGPFNPTALTARQMRAARLISADSMLADLRARQIRTLVEVALLSRTSEGPQALSGSAGP